MMYKKLLIVTVIFVLLSITVSFAWMIELEGLEGDFVLFHYYKNDKEDTSIYISPYNLQIDILVEENGEYVPLHSTKNEINNLAVFDNCAPGDVFKYCIKINNLTESTISTSVILSDINASLPEFYDYISVGVYSTKGFDATHKAPTLEEFDIISKLDEDYDEEDMNSFVFLEDLDIPPMGNEVEIKFFVKFNSVRESQNHLQNQTFTIGKINFLCV